MIAVQGELWGLRGLKGGGGGRVKPHFGELEGVRGRGLQHSLGLNSKDAASVPTSTEATLHHRRQTKEHLLSDNTSGAAQALI